MAELHSQVYFNYMKMCFENAFDKFLGVDLLGNSIYAANRPTKLSEGYFMIKPMNPIEYASTFFFSKNLSMSCYFKTDIASFSVRLAQVPIETYFDFANSLLSPAKQHLVINYVEGGQFWGEYLAGRLLEGKMYSNDIDFNTICHRDTYKGWLCIASKNLKYEGFFQDSLPHYHGSYFINNNLIYCGDLRRGELTFI